MTSYLNTNNIKIFNYQKFCEPLTRKVRSVAEEIARESSIELEFIRKLKAFRKDDRIHEIIKGKQISTGLKTASFSVNPDNIATFLGKRITCNCVKEIGTEL